MTADRIGHYRLEGRIGAGGMGEVYLAYDERLDRRVAIKLIAAQRLDAERARKRFRREARAAASLSHPGIVAVYDLIEGEDSDSIVMELVEGATLTERLAGGALTLDQALRFGREVAEALSFAHQSGVVHRDLKADNVMISARGQVKILDFGLAKRNVGTDGDSSQLTGAHILGTLHAMSPEQAAGRPVGPRSDLFSLGVLLYEMTTGRSPFRSASAPETLLRVTTHRQPPANELDPTIPRPLAKLIDQLLEKDPLHRPYDAQAVVGALARIADEAAAAPARRRTGSPSPAEPPLDCEATLEPLGSPPSVYRAHPPWVAVAVSSAVALALALAVAAVLRWTKEPRLVVAVVEPELEAPGDEAELATLSSAVRLAATRGLLGLVRISPVALDEVDAAQGSSQAVARAMAADESLAARLVCRSGACRLSLMRIRADDGGIAGLDECEVPRDDLRLLSTAVTSSLRRLYRRDVQEGFANLEVRPEDYREYLGLQRSYRNREPGFSSESALSLLEAMAATSPRFLEGFLLRALILRSQFAASRRSDLLEAALELLQEAERLAPEVPEVHFALVDTGLEGGRLELAETAVAALERLDPGHGRLAAQRALILERRGDTDGALELMTKAVDRTPSLANLFDLAQMEIRRGRNADAGRHLEQLLRLSPSHFRARSLLAQHQLLYGELERAERLYGELTEQAPSDITALTNLSVARLLLERYDQAAETLQRARAFEPSPFTTLNLADAELLRGNEERARTLYLEALGQLPPEDSAAGWWILTARAKALAQLGEPGQSQEAVALVRRALQLAPQSPGAAFDAARVYAAVGDQTSSVLSIADALDRGLAVRWFALPWFDALRQRPDFRRLFSSRTVL